jgi:hypothetical protein
MPTKRRSRAAQEASRRNGARSHGPRTALGKQRSARNALRHGLRGRSMINPADLPEWAKELERAMIAALGDVNFLQREHLDALLASCLLLERVDSLIAKAAPRVFEALPVAQHRSSGLHELAGLYGYRRRFRARRDRCLAKLFPHG